MSEDFDILFKIVLIGDCAVGKSCIVQKLKTGSFQEVHQNTIGVDFSMKTMQIDGKKVKLQVLILFKTSKIENLSLHIDLIFLCST